MSAGTCRECERPMRKHNVLTKDAPGTVIRRREGLCEGCCEKLNPRFRPSRAGASKYTDTATANYAHNRAGLVAYLQDRRRRGIKEDGTMQCLEGAV